MTCSDSVETSTGTFTFYEEDLSFCEAKLKCIAHGQILAPVTNRMDADKIIELFNTNSEKENYCVHSSYNLISYWVGLDVAYNGSKQEKKFTNGIDWDEKIHGEIYTDYLKGSYTKCPAVMFQPFFTQEPFSITADICHLKSSFICFKPKEKQFAEKIVQDKDVLKNVLVLPDGVVVAVAALIVLMIGSIFILHSKNKRVTKGFLLEQEKACVLESSLKSITIENRKK